MPDYRPAPDCLVLYKIRPARITAADDKIEIELEGGKCKRVREKDVVVLHPGPLRHLGELTERHGSHEEAWELLEEGTTSLTELAELIYGEFTPATAWAAWQLVQEGLHFEGSPGAIRARSRQQIDAQLAEEAAKRAAAEAWEGLLQRLRRGRIDEEDRPRLGEVEQLAFGRAERSRIMQALEHQEKPENAHRLLCGVGYWGREFNPHPHRFTVPLEDPALDGGAEQEVERLDLTHLPAYAIDDEDSHDPDDAVSLDGERIWVHVADVASLVPPDSAIDLEARARGANLYLPERIVHMLPPALTDRLGLGLQETSPALSFGFRLDEQGEIQDLEIHQTQIRVTRYSYTEANSLLDQEPFRNLVAAAERYRRRREAQGAISIDLPEVSIRVRGGGVVIKPLERIASRQMVTELMLMVGEGVARYALERGIPIPFATQEPPEKPGNPQGIAESYAFRRQLRPSKIKTLEEPHSGLGLPLYTRVTSPLRRYLDLVVHQQLHAHLQGREPLSLAELGERIGVAEGAGGQVRRAERFSNTHWKLVFLQQNPGWSGRGVVVECAERRTTVLIPELALETRVRSSGDVTPGSELRLQLREVDLPELVAWFRVEE